MPMDFRTLGMDRSLGPFGMGMLAPTEVTPAQPNPLAITAQAMAARQQQANQNSGQRNAGTMFNTAARGGSVHSTLERGVGIPSTLAQALTTFLGAQSAFAQAEQERAAQAQQAASGAQQQADQAERAPTPQMGAGAEFAGRLFGGMSQAIAPQMNGQALSEGHINDENTRLKEQHLRRLQIMHQHADRLSQRAEQLGDYAGALKYETLKDKYSKEFELQKYGDEQRDRQEQLDISRGQLDLQRRVHAADQDWRRRTTNADGFERNAEGFERRAEKIEEDIRTGRLKTDAREARAQVKNLKQRAEIYRTKALDERHIASGLKLDDGTNLVQLHSEITDLYKAGIRDWETVSSALATDGYGPKAREAARKKWDELSANDQTAAEGDPSILHGLGATARDIGPHVGFEVGKGVDNIIRGLSGQPANSGQYNDMEGSPEYIRAMRARLYESRSTGGKW